MYRSGEEHQLVGMFDSADAAARAYDQAALKMHGPEAYTNFLCKCCCSAQMLYVLVLALAQQGSARVQEGSGRGGRGSGRCQETGHKGGWLLYADAGMLDTFAHAQQRARQSWGLGWVKS